MLNRNRLSHFTYKLKAEAWKLLKFTRPTANSVFDKEPFLSLVLRTGVNT